MNLVKSVFIFIAPVWLIFVVFHGLLGIFYNGSLLFNISIIISALPLLIFLSYLMLFRNLARTSEHLLLVSIPSFVGYAVVLFLYLNAVTFIKMQGMMYSMSAFLITFLYIYWYSNNSRERSSVVVNEKTLPYFTVTDEHQKKVYSKSWIGKPAVIFFYRGNWCPLCMAQIGEIADQYKKFKEKGIQIILIAPQSESNTKKLADKYKLGFEFYVDKDNNAAKQMGIEHKFGLPMGFQALGYSSNTVYPTIIAINEEGTIIYNDQTDNYRIRPEPQELLSLFA